MKRYQLHIEVLEDLHTGSGTGGGDIDAMLARDRDNRPFIPASHIKGVLLALAEEWLDLANSRPLEQGIHRLLGRSGQYQSEDQDDRRAALRMTSLYLCPESAGRTLVWGATARKAHGREPEEDTLRLVEYIAAKECFAGECRVPPELADVFESLIARLDRLGGGRNRGSGLVRCRLTAMEAKGVDLPQAGSPRLRLALCNPDPICLPLTGFPGNLIRSQAFIRGQALRGALMYWAMQRRDAAAVTRLRRCSVGDALPLPQQDFNTGESLPLASLELRPIPLSIGSRKLEAADKNLPWWFAGQSGNENEAAPQRRDTLFEQNEGTEKTKRPGDDEFLFRASRRESWQYYRPQRRVHLRNQTPDRHQSRGDQQPQLFSTEEIAEKTQFVADLIFADVADATQFLDDFQPILAQGEWLSLGRAGRPVEVTAIVPLPSEPQDWASDHGFSLTLISDLIARGPYLGFLTDLDESSLWQLARAAGACLPDWRTPSPIQLQQSFVDSDLIHGFNASTGLRRPGALALRRGSCWRITGAGSRELASALARIPCLGERGDEGFGRFVLGEAALTLCRPVSPPAILTSKAGEALHCAASELARSARKTLSVGPSLSQYQSLRNQALAASDLEALNSILTRLKNAPQERHLGGGCWQHFPFDQLDKKRQSLPLPDQRQLISLMVSQLAPDLKKQQQEQHNKESAS